MGDFQLARSFFPDIDDSTWANISQDPYFLKHLPSLIKSRLDSREHVAPVNDEYMMMLMSGANFADTEEQIYVSKRLRCYFNFGKSFLPLMVDYLEEAEKARTVGVSRVLEVSEDFASRCLFALSFFKPALERLHRKGGPHPEFYRDRGKHTFKYLCLEGVADNFENWENFFAKKI
jgi:hypothetical protein